MSAALRRGVPLVVSAPSGGGKTTLCRRLMNDMGDVAFSVSYTTRALRGREQDGVDYHFIDATAFQAMIDRGELLEWADVHGYRYGTGRAETARLLESGTDVLFDIDIQGGRQIVERMAETVLVFVVPPSMQELERRLRGRGSDAEDQVRRRLAAARDEIRTAAFYDYWIVNDVLDEALFRLRAVLLAARIRQENKPVLVAQLLGEASHG
ncbi:MAG: guanylate kinase [Myxococcota bacterium]